VLQEGEFYRVGGNSAIKVDVRIVAATHQHLDKLVASGAFREDLFHRLNVIRINLPKLAERREDIPQLARYFLQRAADELAVEAKTLHQDVERYFCTLAWPGNVRQIENVCRWLTVMAAGREVLLDDLPAELRQQSADIDVDVDWQKSLRQWASQTLMAGADGILNQALPEFERVMIEAALQQAQGRRGDAAALLGWGRNTLTRKLKELGLEQSLGQPNDGSL
jgi:two-component system nitrogen regulation response regulator GlnG